ncbi:hypothetical protein NPX13_g7879 [Xylaria arbuscula]|uniref:Uncharacterized protein n=1 Tax=Xylaria arbuscula TaxID=114810 RepID=A0A9W8TKD0_9PEZI|nr:hypothetical protein NPX13_g7879 [Xylaria arbuscula]
MSYSSRLDSLPIAECEIRDRPGVKRQTAGIGGTNAPPVLPDSIKEENAETTEATDLIRCRGQHFITMDLVRGFRCDSRALRDRLGERRQLRHLTDELPPRLVDQWAPIVAGASCGFASPWTVTKPVTDGLPDVAPGTDSGALSNPVLFKIDPAMDVVVEHGTRHGDRLDGYDNLLGTTPVWTWLDCADGALGENVRVVMIPDSVTVISLQVVSIETGGVDDGSVTTVVVPANMRVVSLHVVSIDVGGGGTSDVDDGRSEVKVTTIVVPDCVIVVSLHVVSQMKIVLSSSDDEPMGLEILGNTGLWVAGIVPDTTVDPKGSCEEIPTDVEELDGGSMADVDGAEDAPLDDAPERADDGPVAFSMPVDGVTTEPVKEEGIDVPELGVSPGLVLAPVPTDKALVEPLNVSAAVLADVIVCPGEEEFSLTMLLIGFVPSADEEFPGKPEDIGNGMVRLPLKLVTASADDVLFDTVDEVGPVPGVDTPPEADSGLLPDETEDTAPDDVGREPGEVRVGSELIVVFPGVSPVLYDEDGTEITVELDVARDGFEVDGALPAPGPAPAPPAPVPVTTTLPEVNTVSDTMDTVLLGVVELLRIVLLPYPELVSGVIDRVPFEIGPDVVKAVGAVVAIDVGSSVDNVAPVLLVSMADVSVFLVAVAVRGEVVNTNADDETVVLASVLLAAAPELTPELGDPRRVAVGIARHTCNVRHGIWRRGRRLY